MAMFGSLWRNKDAVRHYADNRATQRRRRTPAGPDRRLTSCGLRVLGPLCDWLARDPTFTSGVPRVGSLELLTDELFPVAIQPLEIGTP